MIVSTRQICSEDESIRFFINFDEPHDGSRDRDIYEHSLSRTKWMDKMNRPSKDSLTLPGVDPSSKDSSYLPISNACPAILLCTNFLLLIWLVLLLLFAFRTRYDEIIVIIILLAIHRIVVVVEYRLLHQLYCAWYKQKGMKHLSPLPPGFTCMHTLTYADIKQSYLRLTCNLFVFYVVFTIIYHLHPPQYLFHGDPRL